MKTLIKDITIIDKGQEMIVNVLIEGEDITRVTSDNISETADITIDGKGKMLFPGVIDSHVHFRDPGLTHKGDIESESSAAVAGGVTSYMDMPNTTPQTTGLTEWNAKMTRAAEASHANYAFWLGATNDNIDTILKADYSNICGIKLFMGSSTGNMLVDNTETLDKLFAEAPVVIAAHCEDETIIKNNLNSARERWGDDVPWAEHANIRSREACLKSATTAVELAKRHNTKFHLCHISTAEEIDLLDGKMITGEASPNHLTFNDTLYSTMGAKMKCNPSIKSESDRVALAKAVADRRIATIATDHAPHTIEEKQGSYFKAPSGMPSLQHSLVAMLEFVSRGEMSYDTIIDAMCHTPATLFGIENRGYIQAGYKADLVIVERLQEPEEVTSLYKCRWSPMDGMKFSHKVRTTFVNGKIAYDNGMVNNDTKGQPLTFKR